MAAAALADTVCRRITQKEAESFADDDAAHGAAVTLWNLVLQLEREGAKTSASVPAEYKLLLVLSRVFAFVILHSSLFPDTSSISSDKDHCVPSQVLYLMSVAIRAARSCIGTAFHLIRANVRMASSLTLVSCIDNQQTEMGRIVLDHIESYNQALNSFFLAQGDDKSIDRQKTKLVKLRIAYTTIHLTQVRSIYNGCRTL